MNIYLSSINLFNIMCNYLKYQEITSLSLTNKYFYSVLNPEKNPYINTIYREYTLKKYYNFNNKKNYKLYDEYYLDDYNKTKNNWKNIYKKIYINLKLYPHNEIGEEIYKCFNIHYYLPYTREENKILEYKNNTMHQLISYDILKSDLIIQNYYDKYFDKKNENSKKNKIEPLKKGLYFENELINFKSESSKYKNKKLIKYITNYSFQKLDNIYYSIINLKNSSKIKKKKNKINLIFHFLIWLNHTFILFINLLCNYVYQFSDLKDEKKIIIEYSKTHTNLINFGLMVNEKFNNINIIFNLFQKENLSSKNDFKIYYMFMNIMKNNFYLKLKPILNNNIGKMLNIFYNENFTQEKILLIDNYDDNNNIETNYTEVINEENEIENYEDDYINDSLSEGIDVEYDEDSINENNLSCKEIIGEYSNLILDFSINKYNANYINHSKINLDKYYNEYEDLFQGKFLENIQNRINKLENYTFSEEINSLNLYFSLTKRIFSENDGLKLINRTKLNLLKISENYFFKYLNELIDIKFKSDLKNYETPINKYTNNDIFVLKDYTFNNKYNNIVNELYTSRICEIKDNLVNNNLNFIKDKKKEEIETIVDNYLNSNYEKNQLIALCKDIIIYFSNQIYLYSSEDNKIIEIITKKNDDKLSKLFNK